MDPERYALWADLARGAIVLGAIGYGVILALWARSIVRRARSMLGPRARSVGDVDDDPP